MQSSTASDISTWAQFFKDALIPSQYINLYANKFYENRIRFDMLSDIDKSLLNEMGITAIGDILSILKHAKLIIAKIEEEKKLDIPIDQSSNTLSQKKRGDVAKRIIENYLGESEQKPAQVSNNLSQDLISRLNFNPSTSTTKTQVVKFNEESLSNSKVVVSSTTNDDEQESNSKSVNKIINLKRKQNDIEPISDTDSLEDSKPLEYRGLLKKPTRALSLNEALKLKKPVKSRLTTVTTSKVIKLNKTTEEESLSSPKESVFKRIKPVNPEGSNASLRLLKDAGGLKKTEKIVPIKIEFSNTTTKTPTQVISLNKNKTTTMSTSRSTGSLSSMTTTTTKQSVHDRLSFKK